MICASKIRFASAATCECCDDARPPRITIIPSAPLASVALYPAMSARVISIMYLASLVSLSRLAGYRPFHASCFGRSWNDSRGSDCRWRDDGGKRAKYAKLRSDGGHLFARSREAIRRAKMGSSPSKPSRFRWLRTKAQVGTNSQSRYSEKHHHTTFVRRQSNEKSRLIRI